MKRKGKGAIWNIAVIAVFMLAIINAVMLMKSMEYRKLAQTEKAGNETEAQETGKRTTGKECPDATGGERNAYIRTKYFYSKYCPWCRKEEKILNKIVEEQGKLIYIEWYDVDRCPEEAGRYSVKGVPTMVFSTMNESREYSHYGFVPEENLKKLVCDVTGGC